MALIMYKMELRGLRRKFAILSTLPNWLRKTISSVSFQLIDWYRGAGVILRIIKVFNLIMSLSNQSKKNKYLKQEFQGNHSSLYLILPNEVHRTSEQTSTAMTITETVNIEVLKAPPHSVYELLSSPFNIIHSYADDCTYSINYHQKD